MTRRDVHLPMRHSRSDAIVEELLHGGGDDPCMREVIRGVQALATAPPATPNRDLQRLLTEGVTRPTSAPATAGRIRAARRWSLRTAVVTAPLALKLAGATVAAAAGMGGLAAGNVLPGPVDRWVDAVIEQAWPRANVSGLGEAESQPGLTVSDDTAVVAPAASPTAGPDQQGIPDAGDKADAPGHVSPRSTATTAPTTTETGNTPKQPSHPRDAEEEAAGDARDREEEAAGDARDAEEEAAGDARDAEEEVADDARDAEEEAADDARDAEEEAADDVRDAEEEAADDVRDAEEEAADDARDAEEEAAESGDE